MKLFLFLSLLSVTISGMAQTFPDYELKVIGRVHGWDDQPTDKPAEQNIRGALRLDGWIDVTPKGLPKGCLRVASRLVTGDRFNNEWVSTGIGDGEAKLNVSLRQLYVSSTCLKNITIDAGSVPVKRHGVLGLSESGYLDGINVVIDDQENGRNVIIQVGAVDGETNLFKRDFDHINTAGIQVKQALSENVSGFIALAAYKDSLFNRGGMSWALGEYSKWLKETGAEVLFSEDRLLGGLLYTKFDLKQIETTVSVARINPNPEESDKLGFLLKQFYGYGTNFYLEANRKLSSSTTLNFRLRLGDAGPRIQTGVTVQFGKRGRP